MRLIFQKNVPSIFARLIRLWTWSPYCHVELLFNDGVIYSAHQTQGTRFSRVPPEFEKYWDVLEIPMSADEEQQLRTFCTAESGCLYDWIGLVLSQVLFLRREHPHRWFCSEICVAALQQIGMLTGHKACTYSPGGLFRTLRKQGIRFGHF
jgi:hypothetical protein